MVTPSDDAAFPESGHEQLPKRPDRMREGPAPDLSSNWWWSPDSEGELAGRLIDVLRRAERELVDIPTPRRPGSTD